jgi:hypothetical protein
VPAEVWAAVQAGAQQGSEVYAAEQARLKTDTISAALKKGKLAPAMKASIENMWDKDPKGTHHLLTAKVEDGGLADNLVPVAATGLNPGGEETAQPDEYPQEWLAPTERARIAAASAGAAPGNVQTAGKD